MQDHHKFKIASLTKAFTAMIVFMLQEKKLLNINDDICDYLPTLSKYDRVSIYHCLTCTSGIQDFTSLPDYWERDMRLPYTKEMIISKMYERDLNFVPGTKFEYSSTGYLLLTKIIEIVTGKPME